MYEAGLRVRDDSAYAAATMGNAASVGLWCNEHCDMLHVDGEAGSDVLDRVRDTVDVAISIERDDELVIVAADCLRDYEIDHIKDYVRKHGLLLVPPLRYRDGTRVCRLLAVSADDLTAYLRSLMDSGFDVGVESRRAVPFVSGSDPPLAPTNATSALVGRQHGALRLARADGYYDPPRGTETTTITDEMGVLRRTTKEHLHRAKRKVMDSVAQYVPQGPVDVGRGFQFQCVAERVGDVHRGHDARRPEGFESAVDFDARRFEVVAKLVDIADELDDDVVKGDLSRRFEVLDRAEVDDARWGEPHGDK